MADSEPTLESVLGKAQAAFDKVLQEPDVVPTGGESAGWLDKLGSILTDRLLSGNSLAVIMAAIIATVIGGCLNAD